MILVLPIHILPIIFPMPPTPQQQFSSSQLRFYVQLPLKKLIYKTNSITTYAVTFNNFSTFTTSPVPPFASTDVFITTHPLSTFHASKQKPPISTKKELPTKGIS